MDKNEQKDIASRTVNFFLLRKKKEREELKDTSHPSNPQFFESAPQREEGDGEN